MKKKMTIIEARKMFGETCYETETGFRTNVIFPTAAVLEADGTVKIYYGASDTVIALATAKVDDLIDACLAGSKR